MSTREEQFVVDLTGVEHHPAVKEIVDVLCARTGNIDRGFFQAEAAYFFSIMAATMRATITTADRGEIPIASYVLALATTGYGKGYSINIFENELLKPFKKRFMDSTMMTLAEEALQDIANRRAAINDSDQQEEYDRAMKEFNQIGHFPFTYDSGTTPALKQLRHKLLMMKCGSLNLQVDEIGSNLLTEQDLLKAYLELYDVGMIKAKLIKNSNDNVRHEEIDGCTPTNALLFGTPSKLMDSGTTEQTFYEFLETGYARRCIFGWGQHSRKDYDCMAAEEVYDRLTASAADESISKWATKFYELAGAEHVNKRITETREVGILRQNYRMACEARADTYAEHDEIRKAEVSHRYFKTLKLAGAYAFIDESPIITTDHFKAAMLLVEESGRSFQQILNREKSYVRLAKYIASVPGELTHADLVEALPFYKSSTAARNEQMGLATAWGYKNHVIIQKRFVDGIEFFQGETLQKTDLDSLTVAYGEHYAYQYESVKGKFEDLHELATTPGLNWINHHVVNGHRSDETIIPGFEMIVVDVDGDIRLELCHELLAPYKFMTYTTKSHTEEEHRFRLIIPMNYRLELDKETYKTFMNNVMAWLPFGNGVDGRTHDETWNQRSKKWTTCANAAVHYNNGEGSELLDVLDFIPETSRNEGFVKNYQALGNLDGLERWFAQRMATGNRNNNMIKYALALVDGGVDYDTVETMVRQFNNKLSNRLSDDELDTTILVTVARRYA